MIRILRKAFFLCVIKRILGEDKRTKKAYISYKKVGMEYADITVTLILGVNLAN